MIFLFEQYPLYAVTLALGFLVGVVLHEAAHAFSADALGDDTPRRAGRITLNPAAHLDVTGLVFFVIAGIGWGSTPVNPRKMRGGRLGPVAVAAAGPLSNLLVVFVCGALFLVPALREGFVGLLIFGIASINALLFVFNLIPLPPLDGASILYPFLPRPLAPLVQFMYQYGPMVLLGLFLLSFLPGVPSPFFFLQRLTAPLLFSLGLYPPPLG
jgi:Zn-dependent protease